jgi:hypothetical protein
MDYFSWLGAEEDLSNEALTIRAQALPPNDRDRLLWDVFFPRRDVPSTTLRQITTIDFRPVADRREWNTRGRLIPTRFPSMAEIEMIPIESYYKLEEWEIQKLMEPIQGNEDLFRRMIRARIPQRTDGLVFANRRRIEVDAMRSWANGSIVVMNPQLGGTQTVSFGFDASRYQTAATAWSDGAVNAYNEFIAWVEDGIDATGGAAGVVMRRATFEAIRADAPQGVLALELTRAEVERRVQDSLGIDFQFVINENRVDVFTDGGIATARENVWPAEKVALIPPGTAVGVTAFAPVGRAYNLANQSGGEINVNDTVIFREASNGGREFTAEAQTNAASIPDEQLMWVMDAGV